ncbi:hypothetical protein BOTCAL_0614g00090 [Botryotinia calthae]|uniref:Uncharacterized protein n=1 Tax=Botryotinia calthae TaxID=38488 RepID=A0A4Y8CIL2_9HELO|nr:hypothetical protein BOTCAL_0614g00090 [Botryotinia calthae]
MKSRGTHYWVITTCNEDSNGNTNSQGNPVVLNQAKKGSRWQSSQVEEPPVKDKIGDATELEIEKNRQLSLALYVQH